VRRSTQSFLARLAQPASLPVIAYLCAYIGTSVLGAAVLLTEFGEAQAKIFLPDFEPAQMRTFGSALYLALLFLPLVVVPAFALVGLRAGDDAIRRLPQFKITDPSTGMLYGLLAIFAGWCFYKIATTGYLVPDLLFDRSKHCDDRIVRRVELFSQFRYVFYAFAYSALPLISTMFLVKGIRSREAADFVGFGVSFCVILYLYASIYMKAPFLIYFLVLLVGLLAADLRWWKALITIGSLAAVVFVASTLALDCTDYRDVATTLRPMSKAPAVKASRPAVGAPTVEAPLTSTVLLPDSKIVATALPIARNLVFRMAIAFPYYVEIFDDPAERCGVEDNRIPFIPKQACFPASKVFSAMYPHVTHVQGQAPAAAHVSALAEFGPWFSFLVIIGCGFAIGIATRFASLCGPTLAAGMIAATAVFAYNLTQVPFVGALTYSQGFVVFLFPIALIAAIPALSRIALFPMRKRAAFTATRSSYGRDDK
jgi:hypothetical protein